MGLGDVITLDEDAGDGTEFVGHRFVDEIEVAQFRCAPGCRAQADWVALGDVAFARLIHLIEALEKMLTDQFGKHLAHRLAKQIAIAGELGVGQVGELETVLGALQDGDKTRCPFEQPALARGVLGPSPFGLHLARGFQAGAEKAGDLALFVAHRCIGKGEIGLRWITMAFHDETQVVHVHRFTGVGSFDDGLQVRANFAPYFQQRPAQGGGVFVPQQIRVGVVVEQGMPVTPGDEHRLVGAQRDRHQGLQRHRPVRRHAERRVRPGMRSYSRAHFTPAGEEGAARIWGGRQ